MVGYSTYVQDSDVYKTQRPYTIMYHDGEVDIPRSNVTWKEEPIPNLTDLRTIPESEWPKFETHHCCYAVHHSKELENGADESNPQPLADEMAAWLKDYIGVDTVIPFVSRFRSTNKEHKKAPPALDPHSDFDLVGGYKQILSVLTQEERDSIVAGKTRARIINVWRPMINPAEDFPLAILDPYTLDFDKDIMMVDRVTAGGTITSLSLKNRPHHRWYWMSMQKPEEVIVFTQLDTHPPKNLSTNHIGHSAFRNGDARPNCPPRQSMETRFVVLTPAPYEVDSATFTGPPPLEQDTREILWKGHFAMPTWTPPPPADPHHRQLLTGVARPAPSTAIKVQ